jgi:hypothetical protein
MVFRGKFMRQNPLWAKIWFSTFQLVFYKLYYVTSFSSWYFGEFMRQKWRFYVSDDSSPREA